ncbi:hypothetical protein [Thiocystis violacea]|uniref:hypothetical protein n=1 Tax=Thiocystis violacea TaxID=13725 RepID=UPI001906AB42|nr:hypothetical protein [Thiocystis violacea]MBK1722803.1 hypothetical protein [Thiocystis violacea]
MPITERLDALVEHLRADGDGAEIGPLSTGERCFVALAADRYDLLPTAYPDPVEAWFRLDTRWQLEVCEWRDWPRCYAR